MPQKNDVLKLYGQYSIALAQRLKEGQQLTTEEQMFIENHLLIVQLALAMSKTSRSNRPVPVRGE
ncbi:MAG TPA: hypothetical protein VJQ25_12655 [Nitrospira sp.]|nr:hypothetical protein [Nitrospira sp.]